MRFRYNPDESLRALERAFEQNQTYETARPLISGYLRAGEPHPKIIQVLKIVSRTERTRLSEEFGIWYGLMVIPGAELLRWNTYLQENHEEADGDPVVMFTHIFGDFEPTIQGDAGYFADLEVVGGESPYVNAVLFYRGHEIAVDESASTELDGQYYWRAIDQRGQNREIEFYLDVAGL